MAGWDFDYKRGAVLRDVRDQLSKEYHLVAGKIRDIWLPSEDAMMDRRRGVAKEILKSEARFRRLYKKLAGIQRDIKGF